MPDHCGKMVGLEQTYTEYFDMLYKLARRQLYKYTGSTAEAADVVQSVFVIAASRWEKLQEHPNPVGWLVKAVCYTCANYSAAAKRSKEKVRKSKETLLKRQPQRHGRLYTGAVEDETAEVDVLVTLEQMLAAEDYQVLKAFCFENRTVAQISQETGKSEAAIRVQIHRLRKYLSKILSLLVTLSAHWNI